MFDTNRIQEMINNSQCFGIAFDPTTKECKQCDVHLRCEQKCRLADAERTLRPMPTLVANKSEVTLDEPSPPPVKESPKPTVKDTVKPPKAELKVVTVKDVTKTTKSYDTAMPEFKTLSMEQIEKLVVERGGNLVDFDKYKVANIKRMRYTMFLKSTYEV